MPIPKFAKAMAKRAKAKPKVIVSKTTPTKQFSRKFAKDDMELAKIRKDKIRKELEPFLKKSKDDLELLKSKKSELRGMKQFLPDNTLNNFNLLISYAEKNQKIDATSVKVEDFESIKKQFDFIKFMLNDLGEGNPMIKHIDTIIDIVNKSKNGKLSDNTMNKLKNTVAEIDTLTKKIKE